MGTGGLTLSSSSTYNWTILAPRGGARAGGATSSGGSAGVLLHRRCGRRANFTVSRHRAFVFLDRNAEGKASKCRHAAHFPSPLAAGSPILAAISTPPGLKGPFLRWDHTFQADPASGAGQLLRPDEPQGLFGARFVGGQYSFHLGKCSSARAVGYAFKNNGRCAGVEVHARGERARV